ncbi:MAG: FAD-dependent oxidoreductase [Comamonadaceae bacterium CG1_02_60_18]|nr:MAG: FAD-dependent oxidoreductase [Comamonadaceae bacterium CG1_02_60_18]PIQ50856.1 MAG: FAD-dependent oxidoreductase [Comamonadaceae bacterium CG12_big_fil_rev_8_21_14_0_65_59_15]
MAHVLIAGGGIGGLSAALACARAGARVSLFERAPAFAEFGAGIQLGPNVMRVLHSWGLKPALDAVAAFPDRLQVCCATGGGELGSLRLGADAVRRYGAPYATIRRVDLHQALLQAVRSHDDVVLHLGNAVAGVRQDGTTVTVQLSDGQTASADLLVAADGGWSVLRQQLLHDGTPQPTGHLAYRAMVLQSDLPPKLRSQRVTAWLGPKMHVVHYPVACGQWLNVVAIVHGQVLGDMSHWDHSANAQDVQRAMADTCPVLRNLIHAIEAWRLWPLSIRPPMQGAHEHAKGRVAFLGDAAHPMVPYLAQGAAMAIEDAATLAQVLLGGGALGADGTAAVEELLHAYTSARWPRNAHVQARAIRNGEIFHATGPVRWGRDAAMRLLGERLLDVPWLYAGGPLPVATNR